MVNERALESVTLFTNKLIHESLRGNFGTDFFNIVSNNPRIAYINDSISNGTAGLILYFVELFIRTNISTYLQIACNAAECSLNRKAIHQNKSLYHGTYGLSVALVHLLQHPIPNTLKKQIYSFFDEFFSSVPESGNVKNQDFGISNGLSGQILGNLVLRSQLNSFKDGILDRQLSNCVEVLTRNIKVSEDGFYWKDNSFLCQRDFSFGVMNGLTGISNTYLELYKHFGDENFLCITKGIIEFQNSHYIPKQGNWPDLVMPIINNVDLISLSRKYLRERSQQKINMLPIGWHSGVAGIILNRAKMYHITKDEKYKDDCQICLKLIKKCIGRIDDISISTGLSGVALSLIYSSKLINDHEYLEVVSSIARKLIIKLSGLELMDNPGRTGLFYGMLGAGYFLLKFVDSSQGSCIDFHINSGNGLSFVRKQNLDHLISNSVLQKFPLTRERLGHVEKGTLLQNVKELAILVKTKTPEINEIFRYEYQKTKFFDTEIDKAKLFLRQNAEKEVNYLAINSKVNFVELYFILSKDVKLKKRNSLYELWKRSYLHNLEFQLNELSYVLLKKFKNKTKAKSVIACLNSTPKEKKTMKIITEQLRKLIEAGFLICVDSRIRSKYLFFAVLLLSISCKKSVERQEIASARPNQIVIDVKPNCSRCVTNDSITFSYRSSVGTDSSKIVDIQIQGDGGTILPNAKPPSLNSVAINGFQQVGKKQLSFIFTLETGKRVTSKLTVEILSDIVPLFKRYRIIDDHKHNQTYFTQGLVEYGGLIYEGTGLYGSSCIMAYRLSNGLVVQENCLPDNMFGEGITIFKNKLYQLTWQSRKAFVYDLTSFQKLQEYYYNSEGWGLTNDDTTLIFSDGTNRIFRYSEAFELISTTEIYDNTGPIDSLNELEYIDGLLYANIWQKNSIAVIDLKSGKVINWIDMNGILKRDLFDSKNKYIDVLNGIAFRRENKSLLITGKMWPRIFEIVLE